MAEKRIIFFFSSRLCKFVGTLMAEKQKKHTATKIDWISNTYSMGAGMDYCSRLNVFILFDKNRCE